MDEAPPTLRLVRTDELDAAARGRAAGAALRDEIALVEDAYRTLFRVVAGMDGDAVLRFGDAVLERVSRWRPALVDELEGVAAGCERRPELVAALNARTEAIAGAECSTAGRVAGADAPWLCQNWDWYLDAPERCVLWSAACGDGERFLTMTEAGLLAKLGVSTRGIALSLNILEHRRDGLPVGVPVHLILREILAGCATVDDVASLVDDAELSASSALTVVDAAGGGATFELSPAGARRVAPDGDWLLHTNHFLDPGLAGGEAVDDLEGSRNRLASLRAARPETLADARRALAEHDCSPQQVCRHGEPPDQPGLPEVGTVVALAMRPAERLLSVAAGRPCRTPFVTYDVAAGAPLEGAADEAGETALQPS